MIVPKDWSNCSEKEALEWIAVLRKNLCKYNKYNKIYESEYNTIHIGDDVKIWAVVKPFDGILKPGIIINNKSFYKDCSPVYDKANELFAAAQKKMKPFETKVEDFWREYGNGIKITAVVAVMLGLTYGVGVATYKLELRLEERLRQKIEKEILQKYKKEQQKQDSIIRYNDAQRVK